MKTLTNAVYPAFALFTVACFAFSPTAGAQCPQQCNLTDYRTSLGYGALQTNTTGADNTAIGIDALFNNISGATNTATASPHSGPTTTPKEGRRDRPGRLQGDNDSAERYCNPTASA